MILLYVLARVFWELCHVYYGVLGGFHYIAVVCVC